LVRFVGWREGRQRKKAMKKSPSSLIADLQRDKRFMGTCPMCSEDFRDDVDTEIRRLKALSEPEFGSEALATAKRWGRPVGIIHHLATLKPALSVGT
jgi:hypothetical protein